MKKKELIKAIENAPDDALIWILTNNAWSTPSLIEIRTEDKTYIKGLDQYDVTFPTKLIEIRISAE